MPYEGSLLIASLNAGSKTDRRNLEMQLAKFSSILQIKAFKALKERAHGIKSLKNKINRRLSAEVLGAYRSEVVYSTNQHQQLRVLSKINKKYCFRRLLLEVARIPIRAERLRTDISRTESVLKPLLKQSFFCSLRNYFT